jgi:hypothetical protein
MSRRRYFNITGPCFPHMYYMLPPSRRMVGAQLDRYVGDQLYWVLQAPRQTGKTNFLPNWARELSEGGEVVACYVTVEACQGVPEAERAIPVIVDSMIFRANSEGLPLRDNWVATLEQDLEQLALYADCLQANTRTLVNFDRRLEARVKSWEERLSLEQVGEVLVLRA